MEEIDETTGFYVGFKEEIPWHDGGNDNAN